MVNSRAKGNAGELGLIDAICKQLGRAKTKRDRRMFQGIPGWGGKGSPDILIEGLEGLHIESKNCNIFSFFKWIGQLIMDALGTSRTPVLAYKMPAKKHPNNAASWWFTINLEDVNEFVDKWIAAREKK